MTLTRRGFLAASAAMAATTAWPRLAAAGEQPLSLTATTRVIEVDGRAATVMGLANGSGSQGLILDPGQRFRVNLTNALAEDTIIHWHGQIRHETTTLPRTADQNVDLPPRQTQSSGHLICSLMTNHIMLGQWPDDVRSAPRLLPPFVRQRGDALLGDLRGLPCHAQALPRAHEC